MMESRGDEPLARVLSHSPIAKMLATHGQLRWRILMVLFLLGSIAVPLHRALLQVANETIARGAVQDDLKRLAPPGAIVSQTVTLGPSNVLIRLVATRAIPESIVTEVRQDLMRRTGRNVQLSVEAVASRSELADLMARLARPAPVIPSKPTMAEMLKKIRETIRPAIQEIWPSSDAPIQDYDLVVGASGIGIDVRYQAVRDLGQIPIGMILQNLRAKLALPGLTLKAERVRPQRTTADRSSASGDRKPARVPGAGK